MGFEYQLLSYMYEQLLYPQNYTEYTKHQRRAYFKYRRKILIYKLLSIILIGFIIFLTDKVFK
jgi:hypothetical protein